MKKIFVVAICCMFFWCDDPKPTDINVASLGEQSGRIKVVSFQNIATSGTVRAILVLRDSKTGIEYLAVMGAGVTEMHYNPVTKTWSEE